MEGDRIHRSVMQRIILTSGALRGPSLSWPWTKLSQEQGDRLRDPSCPESSRQKLCAGRHYQTTASVNGVFNVSVLFAHL